jgi:hypothetical protein
MLALWAFMFENMFFPTGQQEYGILEIASWFRGLPYAEPELITFAAGQLGRPVDDIAIESFALPIPPWVYPVWTIGICAAVLVFARIMIGWRWTATAVVGAYVLYRCLIWPLLTFTIFPPSVVPFWLLLIGLAVDAVFVLRVNPYLRAVVGAIAVTGVGYGALYLQTVAFGTPTDLGRRSMAQLRADLVGGHVAGRAQHRDRHTAAAHPDRAVRRRAGSRRSWGIGGPAVGEGRGKEFALTKSLHPVPGYGFTVEE